MKRNDVLLALAAFLGLVLLLFAITKATAKQPNITLDMAPSTATVSIDSKTVKPHNNQLYVKPGNHTLSATQDGFSTVRQQFTVTGSEKSPKTLTLALDPINDQGYAFLRAHPDEELHRESIIGKHAGDASKTAAERNPVTSILPYIDQYFRIDYGQSKAHPNDPTAIAVYITPFSADGYQRAIALLQQKGYDPSKLEIIYVPQPSE